ncbi:MAG TPA: hypothetical protein VFO18_14725 [Methylomirabilota bacterium]|nr:hypothetical protein [Methylomirabilota bacterium]
MLTIPISPARPRRGSGRRRSVHSSDAQAPPPPVRTVYIGSDGTIYHARCGQPTEYLRTRGRLELDFYCLACVEHITLAINALTQVPMIGRTPEREGAAAPSR